MSDLIGDRLRRRRVERALSQEELAEASGVSVFTISKIERGIIKDPGARMFDRIAEALGCTSSELLRPTPDPLPASA